jgi:hypothetical protein
LTVIYDKNDRTYKKLEKERVEWLEAFCKTDPCPGDTGMESNT